ncbi:MAG: SDR family oxidoreductase [Planctomycetota bacterium]
MDKIQRVLLTGATGYIGGRRLNQLEQLGYRVRCLTRRPASLKHRQSDNVEVVEADLLKADSLKSALAEVDTAFYFVHSMGATSDFEDDDRQAALNFVSAANQAGVRRIIYLGGLGAPDERLSKHLRSRQETGEILRRANAQVIELRASIVIGSGSLSFEMIRSLVERLPVMICPKWVRVLAQPIAVEDVLAYLVESIGLDVADESMIIEIGGPDQVSYGEIMHEYARQRGLRRFMIPVPLLTPYLSSLWLGLVTPVYARVGRKLVASLKNPTLVEDDSQAHRLFSVRPRRLEDAITRSLINEDREFAETRWSDALSSGSLPKSWGGVRFGSRLVDSRTLDTAISAKDAFAAVQQIGGETGWYYGNWLWRVRGFFDLLVGGVGVRRGRRHPSEITEGDALDFWRVEKFLPGRLLRLQAEMKVPGRAWLEFEVIENSNRSCSVRQTAIFDPVGLFGLAYWYALYPLHEFVFNGMLNGLVNSARRRT